MLYIVASGQQKASFNLRMEARPKSRTCAERAEALFQDARLCKAESMASEGALGQTCDETGPLDRLLHVGLGQFAIKTNVSGFY